MLALNKDDKRKLLSEGWLPSEVMQLSRAKTPLGNIQPHFNISSRLWKSVRMSRLRYIASLKKLGLNEYEIKQKIRKFYKNNHKSSVFDFIKSEYKQNKKITDYTQSINKSSNYKKRKSYIKARKLIYRNFDGIYGKRMKNKIPIRLIQ